jgi:hypothetical protein
MLISLSSLPPRRLTQFPSPPLLAPRSATASRSHSKSPSAATNPPKKTNAWAFDPARWWQLDPFEKIVRWGRCQERLVCRSRGAAGLILYSGGGGGEVDSSDEQKFWRIMCSRHLFASCAHSSSAGAKLQKELLRQYLYLGLPGVLTKQLSDGASIA